MIKRTSAIHSSCRCFTRVPSTPSNQKVFIDYPVASFLTLNRYVPISSVLEHLSWCVETSARWPVLFFEVNSVDSWSRHRTEGYTYTVLPSRPGAHELELPCWRPVGSSIACALRRFYIGGSPELEDPTYPYIPNSFDVCSFRHMRGISGITLTCT